MYKFIDLDGVILDSEQRVKELKNSQKYRDVSWDEFSDEIDWEKLLKDCKQIEGSVDIIKELQSRKEKIAILTKINTMLEMQAKVKEMRENRGIFIPMFFCPARISKSQIYVPTNGEILIDDRIKNITEWNAFGGKGILFSPENSIEEECVVKSLRFLLK